MRQRLLFFPIIISLIFGCGEEELNELQNVEVKSAPIEKELIFREDRKMVGTRRPANQEMAEVIRTGDLEKVEATHVRVADVEPIVIDLEGDLPSVNAKSDGLIDPIVTRPEPTIVNAGFPDRNKTLPPRYKDAANFDFQYLDVTQGMNSSYIFEILQDDEGYLWFGTLGGGISRYDGRSLVRYTENQGLPSSYVWDIELDRQDNLWIGMYGGGLAKFDGKAFTIYTAEDGLGSDFVLSVTEDIEGNIWIGTDGEGLVKFDGHRFTRYTTESGLLSDAIIDVVQDDKRRYWFATYGGGITIMDGDKFTYLTTEQGLPSDYVHCIEKDKDGSMWIGTEDSGVARYTGEALHIYNETNGLAGNGIHDIAKGNGEEVWFATEGGGICSFHNNNFDQYTVKEGVSSDYVRSCFLDNVGNMWFGTDGGGILRYHPGSFRHYTEQNGMLSNFIWTIFEDSKGNLWFGTDGSGACRFDGTTFTYFTTEHGLTNDIVLTINEDDEGNIWLGTDLGGISVYDGETMTNYTTAHGLPSDRIWDIMKDSEGNMWIATNDSGICRYDGKDYTYYTEEHGLLSNTVTQLLEDKDGDIWLVHQDVGISEFDGRKIRHYKETDGLSSNLVHALYEDKLGNIWVGHNGQGLDKISGDRITYFTTKEGLSSNYVLSIIEDNDQRLWVCTATGISCLDIDTNATSAFPRIESYTKQDGLKSMDFYQNSVYYDRENRIWWGSSQALTMMDLNKFEHQTSQPNVYLTNVMINEADVDFSALSVSDSIGYSYKAADLKENIPTGLKLDHDHNHLTFHFSGIDWSAPQKVLYSYKLDGVDDNWSVPSAENKADYRNIPVGDHIFSVKCISSGGVWSEPTSMYFYVYPPWWGSWWAIIIYILLAIALSSIGYKFRTIKYRKRQLVLEKTVKRRTAEIWAQKQEIENQKLEVVDAFAQLERKNDEVLASISYAKRIQAAILPSDEEIKKALPESFVLYMPKDIVAGDFYWFEEVGDLTIIAAADCTGHGVPGAMVSVICNNALNKSLHEFNLTDPGQILDQCREFVIEKFEQSVEGIKDGMDISLAVIDQKKQEMVWAGANNPLWVIRKGTQQVMEVGADKQPIGIYPSSKPFTSHRLTYDKGDVFYLFTDGYPDQFGGPKGKKFKHENLKKFLISMQDVEMEIQPHKLKTQFAHWKGDQYQIDDVCIIGFKL